MALSKNITKNFCSKDVEFENAYHKIAFISGNKELLEMSVIAYDETQTHQIQEKYYQFVPNVQEQSENYHKQGYEYLKTLPEYADALDC